MYVEKVMSALDGRIALQFENFKRLKYRIDKLEQIARAPTVYAQLCAEIYRRRKFAASYMKVCFVLCEVRRHFFSILMQ